MVEHLDDLLRRPDKIRGSELLWIDFDSAAEQAFDGVALRRVTCRGATGPAPGE